ncbi:hypothetical protein ACFQ51_41840 [Streptomyces kaempferi]
MRETRPAESLWSIAERELGDGERWREIADLNEGHAMAGGHVFRSNSFLQPGWRLAMPESTSFQGLRTQADGRKAVIAEKGERITVHSGDSLSKIAEDELGDGGEWPALFDASKGDRQPDGLLAITDPDMIYPGQQVTVPGTRHSPNDPSASRPDDNGTGSTPHSSSRTPYEQKPTDRRKPSDSTVPDADTTSPPTTDHSTARPRVDLPRTPPTSRPAPSQSTHTPFTIT